MATVRLSDAKTSAQCSRIPATNVVVSAQQNLQGNVVVTCA